MPQVSDTAEPWRSEVRAALAGRSEELQRLAIEMYAKGALRKALAPATQPRKTEVKCQPAEEVEQARWPHEQHIGREREEVAKIQQRSGTSQAGAFRTDRSGKRTS